jgi:hypothetical protein
MPRAAHRIVDQQPFGKRAVVVRAGRTDREELRAAAHQDHRLAPYVPEQHRAVG